MELLIFTLFYHKITQTPTKKHDDVKTYFSTLVYILQIIDKQGFEAVIYKLLIKVTVLNVDNC